MIGFTLLHVGDHAARVVTVDGFAVTLAILAFAVACVGIWRLDCVARMVVLRRRWRRQIGGALVASLLALAILPSVLPYDHLVAADGDVHAAAASAHDTLHTAHCHGSPATCSDVPLLSGPGHFLMSEPLVVVPAMLSIIVTATVLALTGRTTRPDIRPPLAVCSSASI